MERLTKRLNDGKALCIEVCEKECVEGHCECHKCRPFVEVVKKLADYEDADEQGLLLRLPCKVGDTVYYWDAFGALHEEEITLFYTENGLDGVRAECEYCNIDCRDIGKTVFLTKAEAEQALKQMGE